jgi:TRAP-type C4-dicarboxylate transport system substrate-binding protein
MPAGSLFKANEIKRAVQGGQAQIGEILLGGYANEDPLFGADNVPFLATSTPTRKKAVAASQAGARCAAAKQGLKVLFAVPWPPQGIFRAKADQLRRRPQGREVARLQPDDQRASPNWSVPSR